MTIFKPNSVSEQPIVEMSHWSFRIVTDDSGYKTKHLIGLVNGFGRVSSAVEEVMGNGNIRTSSGRIYSLIGESKNHMDSEYTWNVWLSVNGCWEVFE